VTPEEERRQDPGPTGSQYEEDKQTAEKRARLGGYIAALILLLFCLNAYGTFIVNPQSRKESDQEIRFGQYEVCQKSGNMLREQVRSEFVDLKRRVVIPTAADLRDLYTVVGRLSSSPQVSEVLSEAATEEQERIDYTKKRIASIGERIPDADCAALYPPLEGQTYPDKSS
jgi:hypothetical protein